MSTAASEVHLIACVHGMWGVPTHLEHLAKIVTERLERRREAAKSKQKAGPTDDGDAADDDVEVNILVAESNKSGNTYDGVDWGAERVVEEIKERIRSIEEEGIKKVTKLSVIGYSLGGLLSRYAVGILHSQGFFKTVKPMNFFTIATPNIGLLRYPSFYSRVFAKLGPTFLSRTGEHFYAVDKWSKDGKSLLEVMSEPDGVFYQGLAQFSNITIYGNAVCDITVAYPTALIESYDPFADTMEGGIEIELDPEYPPLIKNYTLAPAPKPPQPKPKAFFKAWFESGERPVPRLPFLHHKPFPVKLMVYALLPVLSPTLLLVVVTGLAIQAMHSWKRIRVFEKSGKSNRNALIEFVLTVEREVEEAMVEFPPSLPDHRLVAQMVHVLLPVLCPTLLMVVVAGLAIQAMHSRKRVRMLEKSGKSNRNALMAFVSTVEREMGEAVLQFVENGGQETPASGRSTPQLQKDPTSQLLLPHQQSSASGKGQPRLLPAQHRMIANLNTIPHLKKRMAYLDNMPNSHATIVSRDIKYFEAHKRGEGVLRHLADNFVV